MKIKDGIIGFIVADALGVPVEFHEREYFIENPVTDMIGYGTYNQPPGTYSDDSSLTLATMDGLTQAIYTIDYDRIMYAFTRWYENSEYTQYGQVFDIGNTTRVAITNYLYEGMDPLECGEDHERANGNGSLMRILPIAYYINELYHNEDKKVIYEFVENLSSLTHRHDISKIACVLYVELILSILNNNKTLEEHLDYAIENIKRYYKENEYLNRFNRILTKEILTVPVDEVKSRGYVISTFEAVLWCLYNTDNYKDAVLKAVNLGHDTDTVAAICGSIAGLLYGYKDIPEEWINTIYDVEYVLDLCYDFEIAIFNQQITNICQFSEYFKNADENTYEFIGKTFGDQCGRIEFDDEMYMFQRVLIRNNYLININEESYKENIETANITDLKQVLSNIFTSEMGCKNNFAKAIKNKTFYNILLRLNELRR